MEVVQDLSVLVAPMDQEVQEVVTLSRHSSHTKETSHLDLHSILFVLVVLQNVLVVDLVMVYNAVVGEDVNHM